MVLGNLDVRVIERIGLSKLSLQAERATGRPDQSVRIRVAQHIGGLQVAIGRCDKSRDHVITDARARIERGQITQTVTAAQNGFLAELIRHADARAEVVQVAFVRQTIVLADEQQSAFELQARYLKRTRRSLIEPGVELVVSLAGRRFIIPTKSEVQG